MDWKKGDRAALAKAVLSLRTEDQAKRFLRDLLTEAEITEFAKRFKAARMLSARVPYTRIIEETGLSSTTVARVSKWLTGKGGGYRSVIAASHHLSRSLARGLD